MELDASERDAAVRRMLSPAAMSSLDHVHETSQWFAQLLMSSDGEEAQARTLAARVLLLRAEEAWRRDAVPEEKAAEGVVRSFQAQIFQSDDDVVERMSHFCAPESVSTVDVRAGHFAMLREPSVVTIALQLCH